MAADIGSCYQYLEPVLFFDGHWLTALVHRDPAGFIMTSQQSTAISEAHSLTASTSSFASGSGRGARRVGVGERDPAGKPEWLLTRVMLILTDLLRATFHAIHLARLGEDRRVHSVAGGLGQIHTFFAVHRTAPCRTEHLSATAVSIPISPSSCSTRLPAPAPFHMHNTSLISSDPLFPNPSLTAALGRHDDLQHPHQQIPE